MTAVKFPNGKNRRARLRLLDVAVSIVIGMAASLLIAYAAYLEEIKDYGEWRVLEVVVVDYGIERFPGGLQGGTTSLTLRIKYTDSNCEAGCVLDIIQSISLKDREVVAKLFPGKMIPIWVNSVGGMKVFRPEAPRFKEVLFWVVLIVSPLLFLLVISMLTVIRSNE